MAKIKVSSITKGEPPCPQPAPKPAPMKRPSPEDPKHCAPPPPPFFAPGPCCPAQQQVVDNITVKSLDEKKIEVVEGTYLGMKAYGIDAKTFNGIGTTGMVPTPKRGDEKKVLQADGTWVDNPEQEQADWRQSDRTAVDYIKNKPGEFKGIGTSGFVPKPVPGDEGKVLASDGSWAEIVIPEQEQADWKQTDRDAVDYIKNKPGAFKGIGTTGFVPKPLPGDENKVLASDGSWAEIVIPEQEQADWNQTDRTAPDYIKNKPSIPVVDQSYRPNSSNAQSGKAVASAVSGKQDTIADLAQIRSGAAAGSTAVQPGDLKSYATKQYVETGLAGKVDRVEGKQLSTEDYTTAEKEKLSGIEAGAQANVQPDWNQTDESADDYIKNKPDNLDIDQVYDPESTHAQSGTAVAGAVSGKQDTIADLDTIRSGATAGSTAVQPGDLATVATTGDYGDLSNKPDLDVYATKTELEGKVDKVEGKQLSTEDYTAEEKDKLSGIEDGAQANTVETVSVNGGAKAGPDADKNVDISVRELPTPTTANSMLFFDGTGDWKEVQWQSRTFS